MKDDKKTKNVRLIDEVLPLLLEREEREGASTALDYLIEDLKAYLAERSALIGVPLSQMGGPNSVPMDHCVS